MNIFILLYLLYYIFYSIILQMLFVIITSFLLKPVTLSTETKAHTSPDHTT